MAKKPHAAVPSFDVATVRAAAHSRWPEILESICGISRDLLDGQHHGCPRCGGSDRFRLIDADAGAVLCNQCFREKNGDGFAAVQFFQACKFGESLRLVAEYLGVEPERGAAGKKKRKNESANPAEHLVFQEWNESLAALWCGLHKPGITPTALLAAGCRLANYRNQHTVFALPIWGEKLTAAEPVGWVLYHAGGGKLPKFSKHSKSVEWMKVKLTHGSQPGWIGPVDSLRAAKTVWKTEGPTDLLAFLSLDRPDSARDLVAITNANGAGERPQGWMLQSLAGKSVLVVHDADEPGEQGAIGYEDAAGRHRPGWVESIASLAADCRHVRLPYPVVPDHGPDLRDWILEGNGYDELEELSARTESVSAPSGAGPTATALEEDDDPHRLARVNLERYASYSGGATIRYWRNEFWTWRADRGRYQPIGMEELRAKLNASIKAEFDRINIEQQAEAWRDEPPTAKKVTTTLVTNVLNATKSLVVVPDSVEQGTWIEGNQRSRRNYVAMKNGILDLDRLLENRDSDTLADVLLPHSPSWFSTVRLPYDFDPAAGCKIWDKFLERNLELDPERIKILQEWAGYLLTPDTGYQKFLLLEGEGSNGKSVFMAAMRAMLGMDNCSHISLEQFGDRFSKTQTLGKLCNISADIGEIDRMAEGYLKSFTSGDAMFFDRKGLPGVDCVPTARLIVSCNQRPRISDRSSGVWRRMLIIPFRVEIQQHEKVANMDKHEWWQKSGECPGIFLWAVAGLARLRKQGRFTDSELSREALDDYRLESNSAREFLLDHIEENPDRGIRSNDLYKHYRNWIEAHGNRPVNERTFGKEVFRIFTNAKRKKCGTQRERFWSYLGIDYSQSDICGETTSDPSLF